MARPVNSYSQVSRSARVSAFAQPARASSCSSDKHDIALTGKTYNTMRDIEVPQGVKLLSYDHGILTAQNIATGMRYVIVPCGKGGSAMMQRVCVGGSRLETPRDLGSCHAIEHADFRSMNWNNFAGTIKNASTSKLAIIHESYMLLDPAAGHVKQELAFQKETMLGQNLANLNDSAILHELNNVFDERDFNAQHGAAYRNMIMEGDRLLLGRVWQKGANVTPTVGTTQTLLNIKTSADLMRLHRMYRDASRTHMVMAGPLDINRTLALLHDTFHDVQLADKSLLRAIPSSTLPSESGAISANISLNSGKRGICISGITSAYNADSDVYEVMRQLIGMQSMQPVVQQAGLTDVMMYINPTQETSTFSVLANVSDNGDEDTALTQAQNVLMQHVMLPLCAFDNSDVLREVLYQLRSRLHMMSDSGPQQAAALAVQGIMACNKASLYWHIDDRFADRQITAQRVRAVAQRLFDPTQLAVIRCTSAPGSVCTALVDRLQWTAPRGMLSSRAQPVPFNTVASCKHLAPDTEGRTTRSAEYMRAVETADIRAFSVQDKRCDDVALCAYNANKVLPLRQQVLHCSFGALPDYGGWGQAMLAVGAMNTVSMIVSGGACQFELQRGHVVATVEHDSDQPMQGLWTQPLVSSVAMAAAVSGAAPGMQGIHELSREIPDSAYRNALDIASKDFETPSTLALNQARSQTCGPMDPGFAPADLQSAAQLLELGRPYVVNALQVLTNVKPKLMGTNTHATELLATVQKLGMIAAEARQITQELQLTRQTVQTRLLQPAAPKVELIQSMPGLRTYPYVASAQATRILHRSDRAAFIVSNQIMVGGMGSQYTYELRQAGLSYRPSGQAELGWQAKPVLLLHATFDKTQANKGSSATALSMQQWASGDPRVFTEEAVDTAKRALLQQMQLTRMDYDAQKYNMWADLDPAKLSTTEVSKAIQSVTAAQIRNVMPRYFTQNPLVKESWVKAVNTTREHEVSTHAAS